MSTEPGELEVQTSYREAANVREPMRARLEHLWSCLRVPVLWFVCALGIAGCATTAPLCAQTVSDCLGRCQANGPDEKPAKSADPKYDSLSECETQCECRAPARTPQGAARKPTPTGFAQ